MATEEAMNVLKKKVRHHEWDAVWSLLHTSAIVQTFMKEPDFIRVMIESSDFHAASKYIRELGVYRQDLKPLINLLISRLLNAGLFERAVSSAMEFVEGYEQKCHDTSYLQFNEQSSWTPLAILQAMIRRRNYECALRYVSEWSLDDKFPPQTLIKGLFQTKQFTVAVTHIKRRQMTQFFPLDSVVQLMFQGKDWDAAMKLVRETASLQEKWTAINLIQPIVDAGDFIACVHYMYQLKIVVENPDGNVEPIKEGTPERKLLCHMIKGMVAHTEFYKALKYSLKFQLAVEFPPKVLIQQTIKAGQYHVAQKYIQNLELAKEFPKFKNQHKHAKRAMARDFRALMKIRHAEFEKMCRQANVPLLEVPPAHILKFKQLTLFITTQLNQTNSHTFRPISNPSCICLGATNTHRRC
jgi:hypothetical protein